MPKIKEIGHAVLYVSDLAAAKSWYCDILDMEVVVDSPEIPACFLSFGTRDHDIALFQAETGGGRSGFNHLAFKLDGGLDELRAFEQRLIEQCVPIAKIVDHIISYGIYFTDPDGHCLEVYYNRERPEKNRIEAFRAAGVNSIPIALEKVDA